MKRNKRAPVTDPALAVAYLRASTEDQALSPAAQRAALDAYAAAHGLRIVATFADLGVSGGAPLERRPGLLASLDALAAHGAGVLLVAKRDRLARDTFAAGMIERLAERAGARIVCADGVGNGVGPEAALLRGIVDVFAQYERALIRARTTRALAVKASRGERVGSVPYGFEVGPDDVHLMLCPREQEAIALAVDARGRGLSLRATGSELVAAGLRPRSGASTWNPRSVSALLVSADRPAAAGRVEVA